MKYFLRLNIIAISYLHEGAQFHGSQSFFISNTRSKKKTTLLKNILTWPYINYIEENEPQRRIL